MAQHDAMPRHDDPTELEPRPQPAGPGANSAQLRRDIEAGATGDKLPVLDPAASPLGTDDEAAGTPPTAQQVAQARVMENAAPPNPMQADARSGRGLWFGALLLALALVAAAVAWWGR